MNKNSIKIAGLALAAALAIPASAEVAIHQNVNLHGYAAGSLRHDRPNSGNTDTTMDMDAAKLGLAFNFAPVTAKVSLFSDTGAKDIYVLEANLTYDLGNGLSLTGGRFQSWLGYEAFDIPNGNFITAGADVLGTIIPNFHEGLRVDYVLDRMSFGIAVVDSVFNKYTYDLDSDGDVDEAYVSKYRGDGSLSDGYGIEAHFGYNDGALSLGATIAYQNARGVDARYFGNDLYIGDVWAQYTLKSTTFGAELYYRHFKFDWYDEKDDSYFALLMVKQQLTEKLSIAGRVSSGRTDSKANFWKLSVQPGYALSQNLAVGAEVNYTKYNKESQADFGTAKSKFFVGVQAVFTF